jgi:hypothetical protein
MILSPIVDAVCQCHQVAIRGAEGDDALFDEIVLADDYLPNWLEPSAVAMTWPSLQPDRVLSETHREPHRSLDAIAAGEAGGGQRLAVQGADGPAIGCAEAEFGAETLRRKSRVEA